MSELPADFSARVRAARAYTDANQKDFGDKIGVSATTVKNYERGEHKPDDRAAAETVKRLAKATKLPEWFFRIQRLDSMRLATGDGAASDQRLDAIQQSLEHLVGLLTGNPAAKGDLFTEVLTTVERALTRQAHEAGQPSPPRGNGQDHPPPDQEAAA